MSACCVVENDYELNRGRKKRKFGHTAEWVMDRIMLGVIT